MSVASVMPVQAPPPLRRTRLPHGELAWREAGQGPALVLLHGIGSGSGSWVGQFEGLAGRWRVLAWDAPGYGDSAPLTLERPLADDYAEALAAWLDAADVGPAVVLGHSLGALVAAAWARRSPSRVRALVLASPARGYGRASAELREAKYRERVELAQQGMDSVATRRAGGLCAPGATGAALGIVRDNMARATTGGYIQAAHMLAHDDLMARLGDAPIPAAVLCGEHDRITTPQACEQIAREAGVPFVLLRGVGHASYVEDAPQFNRVLEACLAPDTGMHHE